MADKPTYEQQLVIDDRGGKLLVSAAAGSGKTKVLVDRVLKYIMDPCDPANIDDFLIITFTQDAAAELRMKISKALTEKIAQEPGNLHLQQQFQRLYLAKISTVHAFCSDILREYAYKLDISGDFRMLETNESQLLQESVVRKILEEAYDQIGEFDDFAAFVDTQGMGRSDDRIPKLILDFYKQSGCHLDPEAWMEQCIQDADVSDVIDASQTPWGRFLMDDLYAYLRLQGESFRRCASLCDGAGAPEKYGAFLIGIASMLEELCEIETWDELISRLHFKFPTVPRKKKSEPLEGEAQEIWDRSYYYYTKFKEEFAKVKRPFVNDSERVLADLAQATASVRGLVELVRRFSSAYNKLKKSMHVADFNDLEHYTLDLLLGKSRSMTTAAAREIAMRFREIMVDEYQDSNEVQDSIFSALTEKRQNLFMVGDVKQSIYRFRLADPGIFLERYNHYVPSEKAAPGEGRKIILSNNFRSCNAVVDAVNDVFRACMSVKVGDLDYGDNEQLVAGREYAQVPEAEVEFHCIQSLQNAYACEAEFVASRILQLTDGTHMIRDRDQTLRPIGMGDIVILLRSPRTSGPVFRRILSAKGIETVTQGGVDILEADEVIWLRNLLLTISNPRQDIPLIATMLGPVFGFTADDLAAIRCPDRDRPFYDLLLESPMEKSKAFLDVLSQLRETARIHSLPELIEKIFYLTHMDTIYGAMEQGGRRKENLQAFYQYVVSYDSGKRADLQQLLEHLTLCESEGLKVDNTQASDCVTILSIHKSKGLEYPVVFLSCMGKQFGGGNEEEKVLSDQELGLGMYCLDKTTRSRYPTVSAHAIRIKQDTQSLSEEMRVLYVAMTRAKDRLIMTYADRYMENAITKMASRMDLCHRDIITSAAGCPGDWILYTALQKTEAGELFALGSRPLETKSSARPWKITLSYMTPEEVSAASVGKERYTPVKQDIREKLKEAIGFSYPYQAATLTPSKQTATQRKGRLVDAEVAEDAQFPRQMNRAWRKPSFIEAEHSATSYGNATHAVMQYIRFERCVDMLGVQTELRRLVTERFITQEQADMVDVRKIATFFLTDLGKKIQTGKQVLREFKFSVLDGAESYAEGLEGEKVLLQGVVDCALIEPDGITILDFKTDRVTQDTLQEAADRYRLQVETYAEALSRIYELPIKAKALYFFGLPGFCWL